MRKALRNIREGDFELFVHFNPEVALQFVTDLIEEPSVRVGAEEPSIDKETKHFAIKIKKCSNFKFYKSLYQNKPN